MDIANLAAGGNLWSIHASFQNNNESSPWARQVDCHDEPTDGEETDLDVAAGLRDDDDDNSHERPPSNPYPTSHDYNTNDDDDDDDDDDDTYNSGEDDSSTDSEEEDMNVDGPNSMTRLMLASSAADIQHDFEPHLEYTQRLIRDLVIDAKNKPITPREPEEETSENEVDAFFPANVPARLDEDDDEVVDTCFDRVHLVSPAYFNAPQNQKYGEEVTQTKTARKSFLADMIHPINPKLFKSSQKKSAKKKGATEGESLVSSITGVPGGDSSSVDSIERSPTSVLEEHQYLVRTPKPVDEKSTDSSAPDLGKKNGTPNKRSSGFKSTSREDNGILYSLSTGKKGMAPHHRLQTQSYLPKAIHMQDLSEESLDPLARVKKLRNEMAGKLSEGRPPLMKESDDEDDDDAIDTPMLMPPIYSVRNPSPPTSPSKLSLIETTSANANTSPESQQQEQVVLCPDSKTALSILLLDCREKIFEIVAVDHIMSETTVGDVLSKARVMATDPRLSQQTYVSLCNAVNELAAPMLPVHLIINVDQENDGEIGKVTLQKYDKLEQHQQQLRDPSLGRLLMAVPEGSTAAQVRQIQRALWNHPRIQRWWKRENRYSGKRGERGRSRSRVSL